MSHAQHIYIYIDPRLQILGFWFLAMRIPNPPKWLPVLAVGVFLFFSFPRIACGFRFIYGSGIHSGILRIHTKWMCHLLVFWPIMDFFKTHRKWDMYIWICGISTMWDLHYQPELVPFFTVFFVVTISTALLRVRLSPQCITWFL